MTIEQSDWFIYCAISHKYFYEHYVCATNHTQAALIGRIHLTMCDMVVTVRYFLLIIPLAVLMLRKKIFKKYMKKTHLPVIIGIYANNTYMYQADLIPPQSLPTN